VSIWPGPDRIGSGFRRILLGGSGRPGQPFGEDPPEVGQRPTAGRAAHVGAVEVSLGPEDREGARPAGIRRQGFELPRTREIGLGRGQRLLFCLDLLQEGRVEGVCAKTSLALLAGCKSLPGKV
jgi:hypothetical protein